MPYFTDNEMLKKEQLWASVCIGGLSEGFNYSKEKAKLNWWAEKRREFGYMGGYISAEEQVGASK